MKIQEFKKNQLKCQRQSPRVNDMFRVHWAFCSFAFKTRSTFFTQIEKKLKRKNSFISVSRSSQVSWFSRFGDGVSQSSPPFCDVILLREKIIGNRENFVLLLFDQLKNCLSTHGTGRAEKIVEDHKIHSKYRGEFLKRGGTKRRQENLAKRFSFFWRLKSFAVFAAVPKFGVIKKNCCTKKLQTHVNQY